MFKAVSIILSLFLLGVVYVIYDGSIKKGPASDGINYGLSSDEIKIQTYYDHSFGSMVEVQSTTDLITINDIKVNRGNCEVKYFKPSTLRFGESRRYQIRCDADKVLEVTVKSDQGSGTFQMGSQ